MPLVVGAAMSYSPLLYRERAQWAEVHALLAGDVPQPCAFADETPAVLDDYARRIDGAFVAVGNAFARARVDAVVLLTADRGSVFDDTNIPQLHVFAGDTIWGDPALAALHEPPRPRALLCRRELGELLAEELARDGFDLSETRGAFRPADAERGAGAAVIEAVARVVPPACPIVPVHLNAHVEPAISGRRMTMLGAALARALALVPDRIGVLVSGGLSGNPGGPLGGWVDDVLDRWVLDRLRTQRSADLAGIFEVESLSLRGSSREIRLWSVAGSAMEHAGGAPRVIDYLPLHHAAAGIGFVCWER